MIVYKSKTTHQNLNALSKKICENNIAISINIIKYNFFEKIVKFFFQIEHSQK